MRQIPGRYGAALKAAADTHPDGPLSLRDLERITGFSYEHLRKVFSGVPVASKRFNDKLCDALRLDRERLWALAEEEKVGKRFSAQAIRRASMKRDPVLEEVMGKWQELTPSQKRLVHQKMAEYVLQNIGLAKPKR